MSIRTLHMSTRTLQSYPEFFDATISGDKTHEVRHESEVENVRPGETFLLQEFDPESGKYSGREALIQVTFISPAPQSFLLAGYVLMSTRLYTPCFHW